MKLTLLRISETSLGTHGVLLYPSGVPMCVTLEEPWRDNQRMISCIPEGTYKVDTWNSPRHPNSWVIQNVPARSAILIHTGNTLKDTAGCILVGKSFEPFGIDKSKDAMVYLKKVLPRSFELEVKNAY